MKSQRVVVAFQGALGAFSHAAARQLFSEDVAVEACQTFSEVFESLWNGAVSYGVIPIENTLHGSIHENYDHLLRYDFEILKETTVQIEHHLLVHPGTSFKSLTRVFSHPVALNQCRTFLQKHRKLEAISYYDTAGSVQMIMNERPAGAGAIASETAAKIYGAEVLRRNLEDNPQNFTRFFLLAKKAKSRTLPCSGSRTWKTSLVFAVENSPGMLFRAMACFALRDINLTKIESRPIRNKPWEYMFYVDVLGQQADAPVQRALAQLHEIASFVKILGSYYPQSSRNATAK